MKDALDAHTRGAAPGIDEVVGALGEVSTGARAQWGGEQSRAGGAAAGATLNRGRGRRGAGKTES
jgi:5-methyltetrahydrofolate--homocysteine methyltransferase